MENYIVVEDAAGNISNPLKITHDVIAPTVVSVTPDGTGANTSGHVAITFNEPMDDTVPGTVSLNDTEFLQEHKWDEYSSVVTIPYNGLAEGTTYTVKISGFRDTAGNDMSAVTEGYTFTTAKGSYTVTLHSVGAGFEGGGDYSEGDTVPIKAGGPLSGMRFKNWTTTPTVSFADATNPETTFIMPAGAVEVNANFEAVIPITWNSPQAKVQKSVKVMWWSRMNRIKPLCAAQSVSKNDTWSEFLQKTD